MQKIVKILEKNVEWLAVALGAAFLIWMVYLYGFQKPVETQVGTAKLTPGEVDTKTVEGPVQALQQAMSGRDKGPAMPEKDFVSDLQKRLDPDVAAVAMATPWSGEPLPASVMKGPAALPQLTQALVTALPKAAPPDSLQVSQGRSNVMIPPPAAAGAPPGAAPAGQGTPADKNWISVAGIIHTQPIAAEFARTKIPPQLASTGAMVLRVDLVRQEQQDDGSWGPAQTVPPLSNVNLPPLPANDSDQINVQVPYRDWAEKDQKDLLQPDFYQVLQADPWTMPGVTPPAPPEAPFDPSTVTDRSSLTPDQQKQYDDYQAKKAQDEKDKRQQQQQQHNGPPQPPPGIGGPGGPGGYRDRQVADDAQRPLTLAQAIGAGGPPPPLPPALPGAAPTDAAAAGNNANPAMDNPSATLPTTGSFDPSKQADIVVWAHDDTVQPGKTYRYALRYYLKNPVMQTQHVCNPQKLADQFYIVSTDSAWTDPVTVKSETNFFVVSVSSSTRNPAVKFDIFRWKNGIWQMQTTNAGPGDMVGSVDPTTQTDFTTGLTVVAVLPDSLNPKTILLTTEGGTVLRRDLTADQNSPEHKKLKDQAAAALAPKTAAAGTP